MSDTQQPQRAGTAPTGAEAAAALAEIQRRQEHVIKAVLVPVWYWWVMAAAMVAYGAARDSGDVVVQAIVIPLGVLAMAVLIGAATPAVRRRVQVNSATQPGARAAIAIVGMILLVDAVAVGIAASLGAARVAYPITIGTVAGAAVLVIAGPLMVRYMRRLMLSRARQQTSDGPKAAGIS